MADAEELEPFELLDTLEPSNFSDAGYDAGALPGAVVELFESSSFPVILVNRSLNILYANPGSRRMFSGFQNPGRHNFIDLFGKFFDLQDIREIRNTVANGANGYSWKAEARIKSRNAATVQAKVYVFPAEPKIRDPAEFVVMFDDVTEENRRLLRGVFMSLLEASKLKDNDTGEHITRINYYSRRLAEELRLRPGYERVDADFIDSIGLLACMHDVGKIGTPDDILNKAGPLSDWEWSVMKEHTKNGAFILSTYPNPMAKEIALNHHEKWNGTGYPFQLEGDMIPLSARIVAIADVYDALRMRRSYKPPFDHITSVNKMMEGKETHFDPALLDIFYTVSDVFGEIYDSHKEH
ncbi:MAG: HD domain-containing protein [Treponema sp.]|jgi:putative two-component system response regulator|nr:HD domain-containing protein [Treponema sp.]